MSDYQFTPGHSRNSSTGSTESSPMVSACSTRTHSRWPSSASSFTTIPDSELIVAKSALHDLIEELSEPEDELDIAMESTTLDDPPLCLCDSIFCEHQKFQSMPSTRQHSLSLSRGRSFHASRSTTGVPSERRSSDGSSAERASARLSHRFPSIPRRWRSRKTDTSLTDSGIRSAPHSRSSSLRQRSFKDFMATRPESSHTDASFRMPTTRQSDGFEAFDFFPDSPELPESSQEETEKDIPELSANTTDQGERSPTPLLPPLATDLPQQNEENTEEEQQQSPLHPPQVVELIAEESCFTSPVSSPTSPTFWSPALSGKPSSASLCTGFSRTTYSLDESPPLSNSGELDQWALKLGHTNFHVEPEPYLPEFPSRASCRQFVADWERARRTYLTHAARINEHHGPTSAMYKHTCDKWKEVEAQWRSNFETLRADLESDGERLPVRPPAGIQYCTNIPSLKDLRKFPRVDEGDVVGPMVQFEPPLAKKPSFLRLFTDPASLLRRG